MTFRGNWAVAALVLLGTAGCGDLHPAKLPHDAEAYNVIPTQAPGIEAGSIQVGDRLFIRVLGESDLTSDQYWVDGGGTVQVPLAGVLQAGGHTTQELQEEITKRLAARFIRDPAVAVSIVQHAQFGVTVEGEVQKAGRFEASPGLTLLGSMALAGSTTKDAKLNEIVVFRDQDHHHMAARFDLGQIRRGEAPDPQIIAGDVIVVGRSGVKGTWHDFLQAAPLFNLFYILR